MTTQATRPPNSPPTQELIDLCLAVAGGAADQADTLEAKMKTRQAELSEAWEHFAKGVEGLTEADSAARKPYIEGVEAQFLAYSQALDKIASYMTDKKRPDLLKQAAAGLDEASPNLLIAQSAYEGATLTAGPSRYATVNLVTNLALRMLAEQVPIERWRTACQAHQQFYLAQVGEIDNSPHKEEPGVADRRAALMAMTDLFKKLEGFDKATPRSDYEVAVRDLEQLHMQMEAAVKAWEAFTFSKPTPNPDANRVIFAANGVQQGKVPAEILHNVAAAFLERVRAGLAQVQQATRVPAESQTVAEELPKVLEAFEAIDDALETLRAVTSPSPDIERGVKQLTDAVERLQESHEVIQKANESYGKVMCPNCQASNPPTARSCEKCSRALPQFTGSDVYGEWAASSFQIAEGGSGTGPRDTVVTKAMKILYDACEGFEKGTVTQEQLLTCIQETEERVRRAEGVLSRTKLPDIPENATEEERSKCEEFLRLGQEAITALAQGCAESYEGLMTLERYARESQTSDMRDGLKKFTEGCQKLVSLERIAKAYVAMLPPKETGSPDDGAPPAPARDDGSVTA
ncbi:MAG: hypothetical protein ACYCW6_14835 [Candidatus Xenobia bacterium]